jgi:transcription-repair coupling factor (superfamily II helicase)
VIYKRLANCETADELQAMQEELVDRFGLPPDPVKCLLETHRLRIAARPLGIARVDAGPDSLSLQFIPNPPVDPMRIIELVRNRKNYKFGGPDRLRVEAKMPDAAARAAQVRNVINELGGATPSISA